jgi:oxygen-independent coproporphyrinogen-3 oxidase
LAKGQSPALARETLDDHTRLSERILLELRIIDGLPVSVVKELNPDCAKPISQAIADGMIQAADALKGQLVLTTKGRLLADALVRDLLG